MSFLLLFLYHNEMFEISSILVYMKGVDRPGLGSMHIMIESPLDTSAWFTLVFEHFTVVCFAVKGTTYPHVVNKGVLTS